MHAPSKRPCFSPFLGAPQIHNKTIKHPHNLLCLFCKNYLPPDWTPQSTEHKSVLAAGEIITRGFHVNV